MPRTCHWAARPPSTTTYAAPSIESSCTYLSKASWKLSEAGAVCPACSCSRSLLIGPPEAIKGTNITRASSNLINVKTILIFSYISKCHEFGGSTEQRGQVPYCFNDSSRHRFAHFSTILIAT